MNCTISFHIGIKRCLLRTSVSVTSAGVFTYPGVWNVVTTLEWEMMLVKMETLSPNII